MFIRTTGQCKNISCQKRNKVYSLILHFALKFYFNIKLFCRWSLNWNSFDCLWKQAVTVKVVQVKCICRIHLYPNDWDAMTDKQASDCQHQVNPGLLWSLPHHRLTSLCQSYYSRNMDLSHVTKQEFIFRTFNGKDTKLKSTYCNVHTILYIFFPFHQSVLSAIRQPKNWESFIIKLHSIRCDDSKLNESGAAWCVCGAHQSSPYGFHFNATSSASRVAAPSCHPSSRSIVLRDRHPKPNWIFSRIISCDIGKHKRYHNIIMVIKQGTN